MAYRVLHLTTSLPDVREDRSASSGIVDKVSAFSEHLLPGAPHLLLFCGIIVTFFAILIFSFVDDDQPIRRYSDTSLAASYRSGYVTLSFHQQETP
jgi:hypothetical protein